MKIHDITIRNFRCFDALKLSLDDRLTILVGRNGAGKSAVLDAVAIAAGTLSAELKLKPCVFRKEDARNVCYPLGSGIDVQAQYPVSVEASGSLANKEVRWTRILRSEKGRTATTNAEHFKSLAADCAARVARGDTSLILPIVSYYGTGRLRSQTKNIPWGKSSRLNGYADSTDAAADYKLMLQCFRKMSLRDMQNGQNSPEFIAVKQAIIRCFRALTGSPEVEVRFNPDTQEIELCYTDAEGGKLVTSLNQLSDGYRSALCLIADIACRMAMLNPQLLGRVLEETPGVVLIDEVDLHLHPAWQHRILPDLMTLFPGVQFIVSTHAPAIIHSVREGRLVVLDKGKMLRNDAQAYGKDVNSVMTEIMDVSPRPEPVRQQFSDYYSKMDAGDYAAAEKILNDLASVLGEYDTEVTACRMNLQLEQLS